MRPKIIALQVTDSITKWETAADLIVMCRTLTTDEKFDIIQKWWLEVGSKPCSFCKHYTDGRGSIGTTCNGCPLRQDKEIPCHPSWCAINDTYPGEGAKSYRKAAWLRIFNNEAQLMLEDIHVAVVTEKTN